MPAQRTIARLDPRAPFVVDTRDLGRRAGSMRRLSRSVPAPESWALPLVEVSDGTPIELDLRLEAVMEGVLVSGTATTEVTAQCGRCLEPVRAQVSAEVQELYGYEPDPADDEAPVLAGDLLDLEPVIRDAVVLDLPLNPLCDAACPGLCSDCGVRLADAEAGHSHEDIDPRWAALSALSTSAADPTETEN